MPSRPGTAATSVSTAELSSALRISLMRLARRLRAERSDESLSLNQLAAIATLDRLGPLAPGELAAIERVQPPSMTRILAQLSERGLVARSPHASDRRQQVVEVTPAAREMLRADRRRRDAWLSVRLAALAPAELAVLHEAAPILERLASE